MSNTFTTRALAVATMLLVALFAPTTQAKPRGQAKHSRPTHSTHSSRPKASSPKSEKPPSAPVLRKIDPNLPIPDARRAREKLNAGQTEGPNLNSLYEVGEELPRAMDPVTDSAIVNNVPDNVTPVYVGVTGSISYKGPKGERLVAHNQPMFADRELVKAIVLANEMIARAKKDLNERVRFVNEDPTEDRDNALGRTKWQGAHATGFTAGSRSVHVVEERAADIANWSDPIVRTALKTMGIMRLGDHSKYMDRKDPDHHEFDSSDVARIDRMWEQREKAKPQTPAPAPQAGTPAANPPLTAATPASGAQFDLKAPLYLELNLSTGPGGKSHTPDALLLLTRDFDPAQPINVLVFNHGFYFTAVGWYKQSDFEANLANAPANTLLVVPEWQYSPGGSGSNQGNFAKAGNFHAMLQEIFDKVPELKSKLVDRDIAHIDIIAHSAGYTPTETEIAPNNRLAAKVRSILLLDADYELDNFNDWLTENIGDLSQGKKRFYDLYTAPGATQRNSAKRLVMVQGLLKDKKLSDTSLLADDSDEPYNAQTDTTHSLVFKHLSEDHMQLPKLYVGRFAEAAKNW